MMSRAVKALMWLLNETMSMKSLAKECLRNSSLNGDMIIERAMSVA